MVLGRRRGCQSNAHIFRPKYCVLVGKVGGLGSRQVQQPVEVMKTLWACVVWLTS